MVSGGGVFGARLSRLKHSQRERETGNGGGGGARETEGEKREAIGAQSSAKESTQHSAGQGNTTAVGNKLGGPDGVTSTPLCTDKPLAVEADLT